MPDISFDYAFGDDSVQAPISTDQMRGGWSAIVGGANGNPTSEQFNTVERYLDQKANYLYQSLLTTQGSFQMKTACRVATTANITLSGTQTIDGVAVVAGNSVLVKNQSTGSQNGIWVVATGAWARRGDADTSAKILGIVVPVMEGAANAGSLWFQYTPAPLNLGVTILQYRALITSAGVDMVDGKHANDTANNIPVYDSNKRISGDSANGIPVGGQIPYGGNVAPAGWLMCYGQAVSRTDYAALFAVIGTKYGVGDNSTTFNVPDKRGRVSIGADNMGGTSANRVTHANADNVGGCGGVESHILTIAEMPSHTHDIMDGEGGDHTNSVTHGNLAGQDGPLGWVSGDYALARTGGGQAHNNLQPWQADNWIIKT